MFFLLWLQLILFIGEGEGVYCPHYCRCGMSNGFRSVRCINRGLISVELDVPKTVEWLQLSHNYISELRDNIFEELGLEHIIELHLDNNALQSIGLNAFAGLKKLQYVDLSGNHLYYLPLAVFEHNPHIMYLNLRGNPLRYFRSAFLISNSLSVLDISNCRLNYLTPASFMALPALTSLNISNNLIESLSLSMLQNLTHLHDLDMSNNKLQCDESMKDLDTWLESKSVATTGSPCEVVIRAPLSGHTFERMMMVVGEPEIEEEKEENELEDYPQNIDDGCSCNGTTNGGGQSSDESREDISTEIRRKKIQVNYNPLFLILAFTNGVIVGVATTLSLWVCTRRLKARAGHRYPTAYNIIPSERNVNQEDPPPAYSDLF